MTQMPDAADDGGVSPALCRPPEFQPAFGRRSIPSGCVAPRLHTSSMRPRRALPDGRLVRQLMADLLADGTRAPNGLKQQLLRDVGAHVERRFACPVSGSVSVFGKRLAWAACASVRGPRHASAHALATRFPHPAYRTRTRSPSRSREPFNFLIFHRFQPVQRSSASERLWGSGSCPSGRGSSTHLAIPGSSGRSRSSSRLPLRWLRVGCRSS
jgi:hypothetical protein